nr:MAG TPA: hypothetical protein [Caudoviricetes sp.]
MIIIYHYPCRTAGYRLLFCDKKTVFVKERKKL